MYKTCVVLIAKFYTNNSWATSGEKQRYKKIAMGSNNILSDNIYIHSALFFLSVRVLCCSVVGMGVLLGSNIY